MPRALKSSASRRPKPKDPAERRVIPLRRRSKHGILNLSWGSMGSGVPSGLQNQYEELRASWVGSIPTHSRQLNTYKAKNIDTEPFC